MESEQRGDVPDNIPLDVWNEILLRVPAESLVHLKRVSKGWCGLVDSDRFVESHLERWRPGSMMSCGSCLLDIALVPLSFEDDQLKSHHSEPSWLRDCPINALAELREGFQTHFKGADLRVLDSCDGVILLWVFYKGLEEEQLLVCNPIMKSFVLLPPCDSFRVYCLKWKIACNGAPSQEYKIIGIPRTYPTRFPRRMTCFVSNLRRGGGQEPSSWKELHMDEPLNCFPRVLEPVLSIGRKVHWLIELLHDDEDGEEAAEEVLVSLDLSTERLSYTRILSDEPTFNDWTRCWLYSDRVMCSVRVTLSSNHLELWVLEDLNSRPIWRKRHVLTRPPEGFKIITTQWMGIFMEAEGKIVLDDGLVYCVSSRVWRKMIDFDSVYHLRMRLHVNSLVKFD